MASYSFPWNTVDTLIGDEVVKNIYDQWTKSNAFFYRARQRTKMFRGGRSLQVPLNWKPMRSQWIRGADLIETSVQDPITMATFYPHTNVTPITVTWDDEKTCQGPNQVADLVDSLGEIAKNSALDTIGTDIYNDGSDIKNITGLQYIFKDFTGGAPGTLPSQTYGNITRAGLYGSSTATNGWYIHQGDNTAYTDAAGGNFDPLGAGKVLTILGKMWGKIFRASGKRPTLILSNTGSLAIYHNALALNDRYMRPQQDSKMAEAGYENLKYKTAVWVEDEKAPRDSSNIEKIYFINENTGLRLYVHEDANFTYMPFRQAYNQLARTAYILWRGELVAYEPRSCGVMSSVNTSTSS